MSTGIDPSDSGVCRKCHNEIPLQADRCSECGFEPRVGLIGKLFVWVSFMLGSTFLVIALGSLAVIADGYPMRNGLLMFGLFVLLSTFFFSYIANKWNLYKQKPAVQPSESQSNDAPDIDWNKKGEEIGEEMADSVTDAIQSMPGVVWSAAVVVGILLGVALWILVALDFQTAGTIVLVGSVAILAFSIMGDTRRINRTTDLTFRWWAYTILSVIPGVGFLAGVLWLARKRQKAGSALG